MPNYFRDLEQLVESQRGYMHTAGPMRWYLLITSPNSASQQAEIWAWPWVTCVAGVTYIPWHWKWYKRQIMVKWAMKARHTGESLGLKLYLKHLGKERIKVQGRSMEPMCQTRAKIPKKECRNRISRSYGLALRNFSKVPLNLGREPWKVMSWFWHHSHNNNNKNNLSLPNTYCVPESGLTALWQWSHLADQILYLVYLKMYILRYIFM